MLNITITRYQPTKLEQNLYTKGRAAKLLKTTTSNIDIIYPMPDDKVMITVNNSWDVYYLTKKDFLSLFVADRKQRTGNLKATQDVFNSDVFRVRNLDNGNLYQVKLHDDHINCECQDYQNQLENFGNNKVACKHVYTVLNQLGYGSLKHYLKHQQQRHSEPYEYQRYSDKAYC